MVGESGASLSFWYLDKQASSSASSSALDTGSAWSRPSIQSVILDMLQDVCGSNLLNNKCNCLCSIDIYVCVAMLMSPPQYLWISTELRTAIISLQASFWNDYWEDKKMSVDAETRAKYGALVDAMHKILPGLGTREDFLIMFDACVPTEWLVTFLEKWKESVAQNGDLVTFIQGVIDKLGNIYTLLNNAAGEHHEWVQVARMSSLLHQLKTISD